MTRTSILFLLLFALADGQTKSPPPGTKQPAPAARKTEAPKAQADGYDPDKLSPGEVACGRSQSKKSAPCDCMKHRIARAEQEREKCRNIVDFAQRTKCAMAVEECRIAVVDSEHVNYTASGEPMPPECKRTCHKARCECCRT